ncbi:Ras-like protein [Yarrowia sp. C11]|nr:Ras-like protein [Yarrowia sp. C11]KAG5371035.1 Ras-like protein [Yarrowia sp. E02]
MSEQPQQKVSIVILGEGGTGKSCITMRLVRSKWVDEYDPTIEDSYSTTRVIDGVSYRIDIIDTAGQEEYRDMLGNLFQVDSKIDAYLLVYDITAPQSLEALDYFNDMIDKNVEAAGELTDRPPPVKVVVGNKCDLTSERGVTAAEGLQWSRDHGCGFMETSAKQMVNIEETFSSIVRKVAEGRAQLQARQQGGVSGGAAGGSRVGSTGGGLRATRSQGRLRPPAHSQAKSGFDAEKDSIKGGSKCCVIC